MGNIWGYERCGVFAADVDSQRGGVVLHESGDVGDAVCGGIGPGAGDAGCVGVAGGGLFGGGGWVCADVGEAGGDVVAFGARVGEWAFEFP